MSDWDEEAHFLSDAKRGSDKLLRALIRYSNKVSGAKVIMLPRVKAPPRCPIARIQQEVARFYGIHPKSLLSDRRDHHLARPRQVAMYLVRATLGASFPKIGRHFNRDHTTALWAVRRVGRDPALLGNAAAISKMLGDFGDKPTISKNLAAENARTEAEQTQERIAA